MNVNKQKRMKTLEPNVQKKEIPPSSPVGTAA
jgi:hypothetical protein